MAKDKRLTEAHDLIEKAKDLVEEVASDKRTEFDERSEKWQEGDAGVAAQEWMDSLEEVSDGLDEALSKLSDL